MTDVKSVGSHTVSGRYSLEISKYLLIRQCPFIGESIELDIDTGVQSELIFVDVKLNFDSLLVVLDPSEHDASRLD